MSTPHDRSRPSSARPPTWVGPLAIPLVLAVLSQGLAAAPPDQGDATTEDQVHSCLVERVLPSPAGEAAEGGFAFTYQSLGGTALDGRSCTVYRLRNAAGSPPTPVRWLAGAEVLVDIARLKRCAAPEECPWFEVARYFDGEFDGGATQLSFGLNADSFSWVDEGLVAHTAPDLGGANASVGTEVVGTLTLAGGDEVELDLIVKSRFERRGEAILLVYEVTAADEALLSGERVALVWQRRSSQRPAPGADRPLTPRRSWGPFLALPGGFWNSGPPVGVVSGASDTVAVERTVLEFGYVSDLRLDFVEPDRPEVVLLSVPLPAFVPQDP